MGKIIKNETRVTIEFSLEEILATRLAASKDVTFTLAELVRKFAEMKAQQKAVELPGGPCVVSFSGGTSPSDAKFVVAFLDSVEILEADDLRDLVGMTG